MNNQPTSPVFEVIESEYRASGELILKGRVYEIIRIGDVLVSCTLSGNVTQVTEFTVKEIIFLTWELEEISAGYAAQLVTSYNILPGMKLTHLCPR